MLIELSSGTLRGICIWLAEDLVVFLDSKRYSASDVYPNTYHYEAVN